MPQELLNGFVEKGLAAGVSVLIMRRGEEAFFGCAGKRALGGNASFARDTIMRMYSMTKIVTAVAVMTLVDKRALAPETPVSEFIPEYARLTVAREDGSLTPARRPLTIRHLLTMTSGIPYPGGDDAVARAYAQALAASDISALTTLDLARLIADCPLRFEPGEAWLYGLSADVLGGVIVKATGIQLGEYMKQAIFDKLGMRDTYFAVPEAERRRVAALYDVDKRGAFKLEPNAGLNGLEASKVEMGGAGLFSTADDFAKFGEMLRRGGQDVLSESAVNALKQNQLAPAQLESYGGMADGYGFGYLVRCLIDPSKNGRYMEGEGAFGWNGMGGTTIRIDPAREMTTVFGVQRVPPEHDAFVPPLMQRIARVYG